MKGGSLERTALVLYAEAAMALRVALHEPSGEAELASDGGLWAKGWVLA